MFFRIKNLLILFILLKIGICNENISNSKISNKLQILNETNKQKTYNSFNKKNLILSILIRFSWEKILPFIKSLIKANIQNCDTVIFVGEIKYSIINYLKSFGIIVYELPYKYENISLTSYRWKVYNDFLKVRRERYNIILSIDIKDSIFQNDIFNIYQDHEPFLAFSYEDATINEGITGYRIFKVFGKELLETIKNERIINAGVIWGTEKEFFIFSQILWEKLLIYPQNGDQYMVNYLIYHEHIFKKFIIFSDEHGPVITIGLTRRDRVNLDSQNNIAKL